MTLNISISILWVGKCSDKQTIYIKVSFVLLQVAAAMGVMCLVTGLIYLGDFFFCLSQRRKFLDDRGY